MADRWELEHGNTNGSMDECWVEGLYGWQWPFGFSVRDMDGEQQEHCTRFIQ